MREPVLIREEKEMDWKKKKKTIDEKEEDMETKADMAIIASPPSSDLITWQKYGMVLRVLLVEADDSTRHVISALLRKCSYRVAAVADGLMAWETLKGKPGHIDLVLTEVDLPSISGYALLTLVTEHDACKNIPVVMMSSNDSLNTVLKCVIKGAADFLLKPIRKNELRNLWQHVLRRQSGTDGVPRTSPVIKLEATSENHVPSNQSSIGTSSSSSQREKNDVENNEAGVVEICMKSHNVLNHSNASAFSWYSNKVPVPVPVPFPGFGKVETGTDSVSGNVDDSEAVDDELHGSVITEKSSDMQCLIQPEMTRREAALMKFRQKRKDRCFEKKVGRNGVWWVVVLWVTNWVFVRYDITAGRSWRNSGHVSRGSSFATWRFVRILREACFAL